MNSLPDAGMIPSLAQAIAKGKSFGRLMAEGLDVDQMIAAETDVSVLERAFQTVRAVGDLRWNVRICRRLVDLTDLPAHRFELARSLVWARDHEGADAVFRGTPLAEMSAQASAVIEVQIALGLRDEDRARRAIATIRDAKGETVGWHARLIASLLAWGQVAKARQSHADLLAETAMTAQLAVLDVRLCLIAEGPKAALQRLDALPQMLPPATENYRVLKLTLLNERGRYNEALDLALLWLEETPLAISLYSQAMHAAQHCDRTVSLGSVLSEINDRYPNVPELVEVLCNHAIDQGDTETAARLTEEVRERSSWTWMIIQLGAACQSQNATDIAGFLAMLEADGIQFPGPYILYALYIYYYETDSELLPRAYDIVARILPEAMDDSGIIALYLRLLIALDRDEEARAFFDALPAGLVQTAVLVPFGLYFVARDGRDEDASAGWTRYLSDSANMALNARSSLPDEIAVRYDGSPDDILVFVTVYNGIEYLGWFLDYYRTLGVQHFFFCDNGSTDGTFEYLLAQSDVSTFRNTSSFSASGCGVFWANHLMRRFGVGHWCLHLDMDEALVFPGMDEGRSLREFVTYLDSRGFVATGGCMIDIYPDALGDDAGLNVFEASRQIDTDYVWMRCELPPYHFVKGGVRARMTGRSLLMTKSPLVKMTADLAYVANNHQHTHVPMADVTVALLHYKFIGAIRDRVAEAVDRQEHFQGARFYRILKSSLEKRNANRSLTSSSSVTYSGSVHLQALGLIRGKVDWGGSAVQIDDVPLTKNLKRRKR
ncbi:Glycosyl transferase family 2 [Paracoccaceae bacterium]